MMRGSHISSVCNKLVYHFDTYGVSLYVEVHNRQVDGHAYNLRRTPHFASEQGCISRGYLSFFAENLLFPKLCLVGFHRFRDCCD